MNPSLSPRPVILVDGREPKLTQKAAAVFRPFPPTRLPEVEASWTTARAELAAAREAAGVPLENYHWDWRRKAPRIESRELTLVAVECEAEVQGLLAFETAPRPATLTPDLRLIYVEYLESAPWNVWAPNRPLKYKGTGSALIAEAVFASLEAGLGDRVGLHALDQAATFYERNCRMRRLGPDKDYFDLEYFEYPDGVGTAWVTSKRLSDVGT